jgi:DNA repair protein RecO (recombination protein O)
MPSFKTPAILLRKIDFGDYDLIIHFFTRERGKMAVMAKSAKKSRKRFGGALQLFSVLEIVCNVRKNKGLPLLEEAVLKDPFHRIRSDIRMTAYASYWTEMLNEWVEEGTAQVPIYQLLAHVLKQADEGQTPAAVISMLFQIRLMMVSGFYPEIEACSICGLPVDQIQGTRVRFDLQRGGLVCSHCQCGTAGIVHLSKGTIKRLHWLTRGELKTAGRVRFPPWATREGEDFLESYVPFHLGREPRSLRFLRQLREGDEDSSCVNPR